MGSHASSGVPNQQKNGPLQKLFGKQQPDFRKNPRKPQQNGPHDRILTGVHLQQPDIPKIFLRVKTREF